MQVIRVAYANRREHDLVRFQTRRFRPPHRFLTLFSRNSLRSSSHRCVGVSRCITGSPWMQSIRGINQYTAFILGKIEIFCWKNKIKREIDEFSLMIDVRFRNTSVYIYFFYLMSHRDDRSIFHSLSHTWTTHRVRGGIRTKEPRRNEPIVTEQYEKREFLNLRKTRLSLGYFHNLYSRTAKTHRFDWLIFFRRCEIRLSVASVDYLRTYYGE